MTRPAVSCESCVYWSPAPPRMVSYGTGQRPGVSYIETPEATRRTGQCRRFPPFMRTTERGPRADWPITLANHWCGEHGVFDELRAAGAAADDAA